MSNAQAKTAYISEQEYLEGEPLAEARHEYIQGEVYAIAGASANHNRITGNTFRILANHLHNHPCQPYSSDMKVKADGNYFYPDVVVDCGQVSGDSYICQQPTMIVEVLSKSTRKMDKQLKAPAYRNIPTLLEYVMIEQEYADIEVLRRRTDWQSEHYFLGDSLHLDSINLDLTVAEIYHRVDNQDIQEWLAQQAPIED